MMAICLKSERHNNLKYLIRLWLFNVFLFAAGLLISYYLFNFFSSHSGFLLLLAFLSIRTWINIAQEDRVNEISIDRLDETIILKYYDINEGQVEKEFSFNELKVRLYKRTLYFYAGKKGQFSISKSKDGFSKESVEQIKSFLERITKPVT
jgi:hypothetical protein